MFALKTSATTALLVLLPFFALALIFSFSRFTEEREMIKIGLSLERRMGICKSVEDRQLSGNDPGMMLREIPGERRSERRTLEYRVDTCDGNRAKVHKTPRKSEKK